jgi:hypothetical protein
MLVGYQVGEVCRLGEDHGERRSFAGGDRGGRRSYYGRVPGGRKPYAGMGSGLEYAFYWEGTRAGEDLVPRKDQGVKAFC